MVSGPYPAYFDDEGSTTFAADQPEVPAHCARRNRILARACAETLTPTEV